MKFIYIFILGINICFPQMLELKLKQNFDITKLKNESSLKMEFIKNECIIYPKFETRSDSLIAKEVFIRCSGNIHKIKNKIDSLNITNLSNLIDIPDHLSCDYPLNYNDVWMKNNAGNLNYYLDIINAKCAWSITTGNPDVIISIVDTRFEPNHEDMVGRFAGVDGVAGTHQHGIWVAGNAVANTNNNLGIAGVGYNCRVFGRQVGVNYNIADGIFRAARQGNRIINVSMITTQLSAQEIIDSVINRGSVLILGAGNDSINSFHSNYADIPGVINVSGIDRNNTVKTINCARNQFVDLCAPAIDICTTYPNNGYGQIWKGTSNAAPQVAGTVGLMLSANPCLTPAQIEEILKRTCDPIADGHLYPGLVGAGKLNAYRAVKETVTRYIQNQTLSSTTINRAFVDIGRDVTTTLSQGSVSLASNANVTINAREVEIKNDFTIPLGASITIQTNPNFQLGCDEDR
jgi:subtilisin family serine protease